MAKAPSKRRGITLGPRADQTASLEFLLGQPGVPGSPASDQAPGGPQAAPGTDADRMPPELAELRRLNADLDTRWQRHAEQLHEHLQQLEQQRDQLALQGQQLQSLEQTRQSAGRLGVLLSLLALAGVSALGFHTWPQLQQVSADLSRVTADVRQLGPGLEAVRLQVASLTSDLGTVGSTVASLRQNVAGVRSDLGSLRRTVDTLPKSRGLMEADASGTGSPAQAIPRQVAVMAHPYWGARPMMPW
jgi:prefoldin subunit 5